MRLPDSRISVAILDAEEEVRLAASAHFTGAFSQDETVMPQIIRAVQRYGRGRSFRILRSAGLLPQTQTTLDWLINELDRDYALQRVEDDNHRFAIALIICQAEPQYLIEREREIARLLMFPDELRGPLSERLAMREWDWRQGWEALEALGEAAMRRGRFTAGEFRHAGRIVESLARHRAAMGGEVLSMLWQSYEGNRGAVTRWLTPWIVHLAGAMRLADAIPLLIENLASDNVNLADQSTTALIKINTEAVASAIADKWQHADAPFRDSACDVLEHVHTDFCATNCLDFFNREEYRETKLSLSYALLSQFTEEAVAPVRRFVLEQSEDLSPGVFDVRCRLVVACQVMGATFPEFERWYTEAVANNWGLGDYEPPRLADSFRLDP